MNAPITRRAVLSGTVAAVGTIALPTGLLAAPSSAFDPSAYVADLEAIGCRVSLAPPIRSGRWTYSIGSLNGEGFGDDFHDVMQRWSGAVKACSDHGARVAAYLAERGGAAS